MPYYCPNDSPLPPSAFSWIHTGVFTGQYHLGYLAFHTGSCPSKPINGILNSGHNLPWYQDFMRSFSTPDMIELQTNGRIAALKVFNTELGPIEHNGRHVCFSTTGQAVLINLPEKTHGFGYRDSGAGIRCVICGIGIPEVIQSRSNGDTLHLP